MANINKAKLEKAIIASIEAREAIPRRINEIPGDLFDEAVENPQNDRFDRRGVRICLGRSEGLVLLGKSFQHLAHRGAQVTKELFASAIANACVKALADLPADELIYAHFLLHGLNKPTLKDITNKILNNGQIMHSSRGGRNQIKLPSQRLEIDENHFVILTRGQGEDIDGLSFQLYRQDDLLPEKVVMLAKCGITFDFTEQIAYIINVQGRSVSRNIYSPDLLEFENRRSCFYQEFAQKHGCNPRVAVLRKAIEVCVQNGFKVFKAIDPKSHPLYLGGHHGFHANYESVLTKAGFQYSEEAGLYRVLRLDNS